MPALRQTNFLGGEIAPMSWGRNDRPFFARGLRTMRNFFATRQHGAAMSRPGSLYITTTRDNNATARLLPFIYADSSSFVIEMGRFSLGGVHLYFRFYANGVQVTASYLPVNTVVGTFEVGETLTGGTSGATAEVLAINLGTGVLKLQLAVTSGAFVAGETVTGGTSLATATTADVLATEPFEVQSGTLSTTFDLDLVRYAQTGAVMTLTHPAFPPQELRRLDDVGGQPKWELSSVTYEPALPFFDPSSDAGGYPVILDTSIGVADAQHPLREWIYLCTLTVEDPETGRTFETYPWRIREAWDGVPATGPYLFTPDDLPIYPDMAITIRRGNHLEGDGSPIPFTAPQYNINFPNDYRVIAMNVYRGRGQLFGLLGTTSTSDFVDVGAEPNYAVQPPLGTNPFLIRDASGTLVELENPAAVAFYQDRRGFAGTPLRPMAVWLSATGEYTNFDLHQLIHVAGESLLFELAARRFEQVKHLVSHEKLLIGTSSSVWTMSGAQGGVLDFDSVDARVVDEVGMTDLTPLIIDGLVLFGRTKGTGVRALVFDGQYGMYSSRDLSGQADHLFVGAATGAAGAATTKELVDWTYAEDPWGLVWAVRADGTLLSLTLGAEGAYGWARHDGLPTTGSETYGYGTPACYRRVCAVPEGDEDAVYMLVTRAIAGSPGVTCVERMTSRVRRGDYTDFGSVDCGVLATLSGTRTITGLEHLEGETVWVVGKNNAPVQLTVSGGEVTLPEVPTPNFGLYNSKLYVGLGFYADLELLDAVSEGTRLKQKTVREVGFELDESSGVLGGQDFDNLTDTRPHTVAGGYEPPVPATQLVVLNPLRSWGEHGRACLRQTLPLPVTVVGVVRELDVGG